MTIIEEIQALKRRYDAAKPRSTQRTQLGARLQLLRTKQLRAELRAEKRKAA
jgi:hypothetical protein